MRKIKVGAMQFEIKDGDIESNISKTLMLLDEAGREHVDITCLPEYFSTGFIIQKEKFKELAEPIPGPTIEKLSGKAKEHKMAIVAGTIIEEAGGKLYKTSALISQTGEVIGRYRDVILEEKENYRPEKGVITPGEEYPVFKTDLGTIGILIGTDIDLPEAARELKKKGVEIIFLPIGCPAVWEDIHRALLIARAFECESYLVSTNRVGVQKTPLGEIPYFGVAWILNFIGEPLAMLGKTGEGIATATLDLDLLRNYRRRVSRS